MSSDHQAAKIAGFARPKAQTEMRWCPYCRIVGTYPTIPPESADGDGLDESVYDCEECGRRTETYSPGIDHDRCRACGNYIARGLEHCERCADADDCNADGCDRKAPWGEYCSPRCQEVTEREAPRHV